jgi:hypothetical protein
LSSFSDMNQQNLRQVKTCLVFPTQIDRIV